MFESAEPSCHSYLGDRLKSLKRQHILADPNRTFKVLLIPLPDVVVFPGETVPLRLQDEQLARRVNDIIRESQQLSEDIDSADVQLVGVVTVMASRMTGRSILSATGTTLEIKSAHFSEPPPVTSPYQQRELVLTAKGRYRFRVQSTQTEGPGVRYATATLCVESECGRPWDHEKQWATSPFPPWVYDAYSPATLARQAYTLAESSLSWNAESTVVLRRWGELSLQGPEHVDQPSDPAAGTAKHGLSELESTSHRSDTHSKRSRLGHIDDHHTNTSTGMGSPGTGSSPNLSLTATTSHDHYFCPHVWPTLGAERDPVGFSYFLAANLPLPTNQLLGLLVASDAIDRLRMCILLMEEGAGKVLACALCRQPLASKQQVFTVPGAEGVTGAYVNPHGAVHQTTTVRRLLDTRSVLLHGAPTAQDSWFPGYAWSIASCGRCLNHLGWRFTLVRPQGPRSPPHESVRADALVPSFIGDDWWQQLRSAMSRQSGSAGGDEDSDRGSEGSSHSDDGEGVSEGVSRGEDWSGQAVRAVVHTGTGSRSRDGDPGSGEEDEGGGSLEDGDEYASAHEDSGDSHSGSEYEYEDTGMEESEDMEWEDSTGASEVPEGGGGGEDRASAEGVQGADPHARVAVFWGLRRSALVEV